MSHTFIRRISKIKDFIASCILWNMGTSKVIQEAPLWFLDGIISINSDESILIGKNQPELYAFNIGEYEDLRVKYKIVDKDVFIGRDSNYLLFRDNSLKIETKELNITADKIIFNGVEITVLENILSINGKQVAVVGGNLDLTNALISTSGQ